MKIALVGLVETRTRGGTSWIGLGYLYSALTKEFDVDILYYTFEEIELATKIILQKGYDLVGLSVMQFNYIASMQLCKALKTHNSQIYTVAGNILPSLYPEEVIKHNDVDFVIVGEGEETFLELCQCLKNNKSLENCKGLAYIQKGHKIIVNAKREKILDLDQLSFPFRKVSDDHTAIGVVGSRGCDGSCTFCDSKAIHGNTIRTRSMGNIIAEIKELVEDKRCKIISFYDSTFCTKSDKALSRLHELYDYIQKSGLQVYFDLNMRSEQFRDDLLSIIQKLCSIGLYCLLIGIEAGNDEDLRLYGKPSTVADHYSALAALEKINSSPDNDTLYIDYGFINFNPYTSIDKLYKNIDFLSKSKLDVSLSILSSRLLISGGAPICKKIVKDGLLIERSDSIIIDPLGYKFANNEIQKIYDTIKYCAKLMPLNINSQFTPHYILYRKACCDHQIIDDPIIDNFKYYRLLMQEISSFSTNLFVGVLDEFQKYNDINQQALSASIENFLNTNSSLLDRVKAYQIKVYMKLKRNGFLINY